MAAGRRVGAAAVAVIGLAAALTHTAVSLRQEAAATQFRPRRDALGSPSPESTAAMLGGLSGKTAREKIESAHDAATRTHELGFGTDESAARAK